MKPAPKDPRFVLIPAQKWSVVGRIITTFGYDPDRCVSSLDQAFASGIALNGVSDDGSFFTFIDCAISSRNAAALTYLLDKNPHLAKHPNTLLAHCVWCAPAVDILLKAGHTFAQAIVDDEKTVWSQFWSIDTRFFKTMAEQGVDLNANIDIRGYWNVNPERLGPHDRTDHVRGIWMPPLAWAARAGSAVIVDGLLRAGVNSAMAGNGGNTFLHTAVIQDTVNAHAKMDDQEHADNFREVIAAAVANGVSLDMVNDAQQTALHVAAKRGYTNKARVLVEHGASVEALDAQGKTPLMVAKAAKRTEVVAILSAAAARLAMQKVTDGHARKFSHNGVA